MKSSNFFPFIVLLDLGILASCYLEEIKDGPIKIGRCPFKKSTSCLRHKISQCDYDWHCPGPQRCCQDHCDFKCTDPLPSHSLATKPGACSMCRGICLMFNPPNKCERDGECEGKYKCCQGAAGRVCLPPQ